MADLSISNVVSVSLNEPQIGLPNFNKNTIAIFTKTQSLNASVSADGYGIYKDSLSVGKDFGTTSEAFEQASAVFAQSPNIISAGGHLIVIPMLLSQPATSGKFETPNIYDKIADFKLIDDGAFKISIDRATTVDITGCDFTAITDLASLASVIDAKLTSATCTANATNGSLVFTSESTGASSSIAITAYTTSGTDLTTEDYMNIANGVTTAGRSAGDETLLEAITRTQSLVFYVGILATFDMASEIVAVSNYVQGLRKLLFFPQNATSSLNPGGVFYNIKSANNTHTRCLLYTAGSKESRLYASAYASKGMSVNFAGSNTAITMNLKDLATITKDENITQTIYNKCAEYGVDTYSSISGIGKVISNGILRYFDSIFNEIAYILDLEVASFNALAKVSTKVPQTEEGIEILKGVYRGVCEQYVNNAFLSKGTWTSVDTFGNPEDLKRNIEDFGFYIYSQPLSQQNIADREARKAPLIQIAIKESGAIHSTTINIYRNA